MDSAYSLCPDLDHLLPVCFELLDRSERPFNCTDVTFLSQAKRHYSASKLEELAAPHKGAQIDIPRPMENKGRWVPRDLKAPQFSLSDWFFSIPPLLGTHHSEAA